MKKLIVANSFILGMLLFTSSLKAQSVWAIDSFYQISAQHFTLATPDSSYIAEYIYPQVVVTTNRNDMEHINELLLDYFLPPAQEIIDFRKEVEETLALELLHENDSTQAEYEEEEEWERYEISYEVRLASPYLLSIQYNYNHDFAGMMHPQWESNFFNINLHTGQRIDGLDELFIADSSDFLNRQIKKHNPDHNDLNIHINVNSHAEFGIFQNKDSSLWLEIYIGPYEELEVIENGEINYYSNGYIPISLIVPLEDLKEIIDLESILGWVIHGKEWEGEEYWMNN